MSILQNSMARLYGVGNTENEAIRVEYFRLVCAEGVQRVMQVERADEKTGQDEPAAEQHSSYRIHQYIIHIYRKTNGPFEAYH